MFLEYEVDVETKTTSGRSLEIVFTIIRAEDCTTGILVNIHVLKPFWEEVNQVSTN